MDIYCGNLSFDSSESDIETLFAGFGGVSRTSLVTNKFTGKSRGFAFVTMDDDAQAQTSIDELNAKDFMGRELQVSQARPKKEFDKD